MDFTFTPDQEALRDRAREAGLRWRDEVARWDLDDEAPYHQVVASMADYGLLGLTMPSRYGGQDLTAMDYVVVVEELFRRSQHWITGEPTFCSTGPGPSIILLADDEATREKFLPDVIAGRKACGIALTEPDHGSDLTHLETTAVPDGDGYVLNGSKRFITGCPINEVYATFVRFDGIPGAKGIGAVVVEKGMPGLRLERGARFVGSRGVPHGEMHFTNCLIPKENVVTGPGRFAELMTAFNMERVHNSTYCLAFAEAAYDETVAYCEKRQAFGREIIQFQATYHALVEMWLDIESHRLLTYRAAANAAQGRFPDALEVSLAKLSGCTMLPQVTLKGMVLSGGDGATLDFPIQRLHRDAVAAMVAGGSPPVLKNAIAGQLFTHRRFPQT